MGSGEIGLAPRLDAVERVPGYLARIGRQSELRLVRLQIAGDGALFQRTLVGVHVARVAFRRELDADVRRGLSRVPHRLVRGRSEK